MTDDQSPATPPQDTGPPDSVETDGAALSSAEDLDEDRLSADPLEAGMDPPEHWSGVDKYGMTPYEQSHPRPLGDRLAEEEPDDTGQVPSDPDEETRVASEAGESVRTAEPPD
jgi:hypothetical protein